MCRPVSTIFSGSDWENDDHAVSTEIAELIGQPIGWAWAATSSCVLCGLLVPVSLAIGAVPWSWLGYMAGLVASALVMSTNLIDRKREVDQNYIRRHKLRTWMRSVRLAAFAVSLTHIVLLAWEWSL